MKNYRYLDSFVVAMCVLDNTVDGITDTLTVWETALLSALTSAIAFNSKDARLLEIYVTGMTKEIQIPESLK